MSNNTLSAIRDYLNQSIVGQTEFINQLLIALLADGHILVEGPPGLAKTRAVKALSECIEGDFHRVQFTPDLLPADLTGTDVFHPETASFSFQKGPIFHNLVLADEINRAPAKVQSALLEAMAEQQITVGSNSYKLPKLFMVMATQNPIEQEGTYPLPEAQLDRFMFKLCLNYPDAENELKILQLTEREAKQVHLRQPEPLTQQKLFALRRAIMEVHIAPQLNQYIVDLVVATRQPERYTDEFSQWLEFGASPRASISLARAARAKAWLDGRDFVSPEDIQQLAYPVLRHRLLLSYQAQAKGIQADAVIQRLLELVAFA
ncbi:ATPase AAA [Agarivorans sp. OAG1]|uniref:MoxR-like ATPase in aerotolerance operon n=1 Tax=Agarivorans albus MKT 106 TaxID=1331007 RepID=R9PQV7_AGAAL|nr:MULTISPECIES: MoxR family ATPase [Agarivorans]MPW28629.1 AAA domain-containing protein [Agarivorans sp. B2Z047]UQN41190.1 MoxR family ATPase [Agarivorans sp. B2Z047]BEU02855.1 ATPase AAA [Agarivorans sp. OAG1]GAD03668.1 moxR-like ATPase in aerotolerance operon [Agarivorans albus MKT 106]